MQNTEQDATTYCRQRTVEIASFKKKERKRQMVGRVSIATEQRKMASAMGNGQSRERASQQTRSVARFRRLAIGDCRQLQAPFAIQTGQNTTKTTSEPNEYNILNRCTDCPFPAIKMPSSTCTCRTAEPLPTAQEKIGTPVAGICRKKERAFHAAQLVYEKVSADQHDDDLKLTMLYSFFYSYRPASPPPYCMSSTTLKRALPDSMRSNPASTSANL